MDLSELKHLEQKVKLSQLIREHGYKTRYTYSACVLACAYKGLTGRDFTKDFSFRKTGENTPVAFAAKAFGVPHQVAFRAEGMCFRGDSPSRIARYVESKGF